RRKEPARVEQGCDRSGESREEQTAQTRRSVRRDVHDHESWRVWRVVRHAHHQPASGRDPGCGQYREAAYRGDDAIAIPPMGYLTLGYDHRIIDGAVADQFMSHLKRTLETWDVGAED